jgi:hypothetical protein
MLLFFFLLASAFFEGNQVRRLSPGIGFAVSCCEIQGGREIGGFLFCSRRTFMLLLLSGTMSSDSSWITLCS